MRIGMIGAGNIGSTLARLLAEAGYDVIVSNARGPGTLTGLVAQIGERASARTTVDAAKSGDVIVVAVPFEAYRDLPVTPLAGKIVVDATNDWSGGPPDSSSSSERFAAFLAGATVVKAFNTIHYVHLAEQGTATGTPGRRAIPIAGDDAAAKAAVTQLIDDVGFDVYDLGPLSAGRLIEPGSPVFNVGLTRDEVAAALA